MKAKSSFAVMLLAVLLVFASCETGSDHATLRVNLRKDSRSIVPADYPLEIESYRISGTGPGGASFSIETNKETASLEGLVIGEWEITAEGLNSKNDILVTGSTTHKLSPTNGSCTIILENLTGTGSLEIILKWDPDRIAGEASIELELTPQYGDKETRLLDLTSMDSARGQATYTGTDYPSGSYVLAARLFDGSVQVAGFVEAVRIAGDQKSTGEVEFDLDKYPLEPGTLDLVNNTGIPVSCTITGLEDSVDADIPVTVCIECNTDDVSSYEILWYLDGNLIGEGEEVEFTPEVGTHRLDVVASTSRLGTSGSASINFEAVSAAAPGVPSHGNVVENGEGIEIAGSTIVRFLPDGNAMILSNTERTVHIASIIRSSLDIQREYTFDDLGIDGTVQDFESMKISDGLSKVLIAQEDPIKAIVFNYNPSSVSLSRFSEGVPVSYYYPEDNEVSEIGSVAMMEDATVNGVEGTAIMTVSDLETDEWKYITVSLTRSTGDDLYFDDGLIMNSVYEPAINDVGDRISTSNQTLFQIFEDGELFFASYNKPRPGRIIIGFINPGREYPDRVDEFMGTTTGALLSPNTMMMLGDYALILKHDYTENNDWTICSSTKMDHEAISLITSADYEYAYYIDVDTDEIVTLDISSDGTSVSEVGRTALSKNGIDSLAISSSGATIIAYDSDNADSLMVFRTTR